MIINKKVSNKISVYPQPFLFSPYLMKYLFILLLALPIAAQAQLEAGADYGLNFYRLTNRVRSSRASYNYNSQGGAPFTETAGRGSTLSLSYRFHKKLLAGIGYDRYVLPLSTPFLTPGDYYFAHPMNNFYGYVGMEYHSGRVSVAPQLLAGKSMVAGCYYIYPGSTTDGSGLLVAFRVSANYDIWHGICINVEGTGGTSRLTLNTQNNTAYSYANRAMNVTLFSIAAGVHYRLEFHKGREKGKP